MSALIPPPMTTLPQDFRRFACLTTIIAVTGLSGCKQQSVEDVPALPGSETKTPAAKPAAPAVVENKEAEEAAKLKAEREADEKAFAAAARSQAAATPAPKPESEKPAPPATPAVEKKPETTTACAPCCEAAAQTNAPATDDDNLQAERAEDQNAFAKARIAELIAELEQALPADKPRIVIQVNRVSGADVDKAELTRMVRDEIGNAKHLVTTESLHGKTGAENRKAIHVSFADEARILGTVSSGNPADAPNYIVKGAATKKNGVVELTLSAMDTGSGKVVWKADRSL